MFKATRLTVLFSGICALVLSMGIARYSFTPMIPGMIESAGMTESLAGWLAGWNYIGYLAGLFLVWLITDLQLKDFAYRYGLIVAVLATAMMAAHDHALVWYASRFFAGVSSAVGFMLGTGLIMNWLHHNNIEGELGFHFSGIGLGIIVSALIADVTMGDIHWRLQWVILAGAGLILALPAIALLPQPKDKEIEMAREGEMLVKVTPPSDRWLWMLTIAYFCAGWSNTLNVTFTSLIAELQPLPGFGAKMWLLVGIAAVPAPMIWDRVARKTGPLDALRIAFVANIMGNITLATTGSLEMTMLAAVLFGFTFMGIVSLTLSTVGRLYGTKATNIMARLTLFYCIAQILSPIMSGIVAETTGSFTAPLFVVSGLMVIGIVSLFMLRGGAESARLKAHQ